MERLIKIKHHYLPIYAEQKIALNISHATKKQGLALYGSNASSAYEIRVVAIFL
jgi:hypothetical protein